MRKLFVTGIGTDIGKTIVSAIIVEKLKANYWKPIQAGNLENTDTMTVRSLVSNKDSVFYPESYQLKNPLSPHHAAALEDISIDPEKIIPPESKNENLIIEGAGGLMVPLTDKFLVINLIKMLEASVLMVCTSYLGSINHTLLSIEAIQNRGLPFEGVVFTGNSNPESERVILEYSGVKCLGRIPFYKNINKSFITQCTKLITI